MYTIENIIRTVTRTDDKLNIILLCDNEEDYITQLCKTGHNFYIFNDMYDSQWKRDATNTPINLHRYPTYVMACQRYYDFIIVFNRLHHWERARALSQNWHIPIIVVDLACMPTRSQHPIHTNLIVNNPEQLLLRSEVVSVGSSQFITDSWTSNYSSFSTTINLPHNPVEREQIDFQNNNLIAIDSDLPKGYLESLPLNIDNKYTVSLSFAAFYLNLWKAVTIRMLEAMALGIPVITFNSHDVFEIIGQPSALLIEDMNLLNDPLVIKHLKAVKNMSHIRDNALEYIKQHSPQQFLDGWNRLFDYAQTISYTRDSYV